MSRPEMLAQLDRPSSDPWDIAIIGGGAVGMGTALDAVSRGYDVVLLEQHDFGKGTSSRSTKLIHGGVRYLAQGNIPLVREALHERGLLLHNAPSVVTPLRFVIPCHSWGERLYYWTGMKAYDALAGRLGAGKSCSLSAQSVAEIFPTLRNDRVSGGVSYFDAQFDDARLVIVLAQNVKRMGGVPLNYIRVDGFIRRDGKVAGVLATDAETTAKYEVHAKVVVNATGVFSDEIRRMESPSVPSMISASQGIHLVVPNRFFNADDALMIPRTADGRVLFAIPWLGRIVLGTTDTPVSYPSLEPRPLAHEVEYLLDHFSDYLDPAPTREDVLSVFAGLRPLVSPDKSSLETARISREHRVVRSEGGLISVLGGKWTTYRKMAEDVVDTAEQVADWGNKRSSTRTMQLADEGSNSVSRTPTLDGIERTVDQEFARTVEDVLARRYRLLLLDAARSATFAPQVAKVIAGKTDRSAEWEREQISHYEGIARQYSL